MYTGRVDDDERLRLHFRLRAVIAIVPELEHMTGLVQSVRFKEPPVVQLTTMSVMSASYERIIY